MTNFRGLVPAPLVNVPSVGIPPLYPNRRESFESGTPVSTAPKPSLKAMGKDQVENANPLKDSTRQREVTIASAVRHTSSSSDSGRRQSSGFSISDTEELSPEESARCLRFFANLDTTNDGSIGIQELISSCRLIGIQLSERYILEIIDTVPKASNWKLTETEYGYFMRVLHCLVSPEVWKVALDKMEWVTAAILREKDLPKQRDEYISEAVQGKNNKVSFFLRWYLSEFYYIFAPLYYAALLPLSLISGDTDVHPVRIGWEVFLTVVAILDAIQNARANERATPSLIDSLAAIPLDLFGIFTNQETLYGVGCVIRLFATLKINSSLSLKNGGILSTTLVRFSTGLLPLFRQIFFVLLTLHLVACLFVRAACLTHNCRSMPSFDEYQTAIYWTLYTISSVGYGDIPIDTKDARALATFCFCLSIVVNGWLVGRVTSYMVLDTEGEKQHMMHRTLQVITHYHLPKDVVEDILTLQHYMLGKKIALKSFTEVVDGFPNVVRQQLSLYVRVDHMNKIPMFLSLSPFCKVALAEVLQTKILAREEHVIVEHEKGSFMFFILHGFAEVVKGSQHVATLTKGAMAGEMALMLNESTRTATITTLTLCEILTLERDDFESISEKHPSLRLSIECEVSRRNNHGQAPSPPEAPSERKKLKKRHTLVGNAIVKHLQRRNMELRGMKIAADELRDQEDSRTPSIPEAGQFEGRRLSLLSDVQTIDSPARNLRTVPDEFSICSPTSRRMLDLAPLAAGSETAVTLQYICDRLNVIYENQKALSRQLSTLDSASKTL